MLGRAARLGIPVKLIFITPAYKRSLSITLAIFPMSAAHLYCAPWRGWSLAIVVRQSPDSEAQNTNRPKNAKRPLRSPLKAPRHAYERPKPKQPHPSNPHRYRCSTKPNPAISRLSASPTPGNAPRHPNPARGVRETYINAVGVHLHFLQLI